MAVSGVVKGWGEVFAKFPEEVRARYDFTKAVYTGALARITGVVCPQHGEFSNLSAQFRKGRGCAGCGALQRGVTREATHQKANTARPTVVGGGDFSDLPRTRKGAMAQGVDRYFTGKPCKHGHIAPRKTKGSCVECVRAESANPTETRVAYYKAYNTSAAGIATKQRYYERNRDMVIARAQARPKEEKQAYKATWKARNPVWVQSDNNSRRRRNREATPPWITREQKAAMQGLYQVAMLLSKTTGKRYEVDHIIPLRGETVSGLHVPWNLQVIPQEENLRKSNKHLVDTPPNSRVISKLRESHP